MGIADGEQTEKPFAWLNEFSTNSETAIARMIFDDAAIESTHLCTHRHSATKRTKPVSTSALSVDSSVAFLLWDFSGCFPLNSSRNLLTVKMGAVVPHHKIIFQGDARFILS